MITASLWSRGTRFIGRNARLLLRQASGQAARCTAEPNHIWSIGIYVGPSPYELRPAREARNPVLVRSDVTDATAWFCADPFMLKVGSLWHMFFEYYNSRTEKGEFALATSPDALRWKYQQKILAEPFHITYPQVFESQGDYFMIPDSSSNADLRLYKARNFPTDWTLAEILFSGARFVDTTIFRYDEKWWFFTESSEVRNDTLRLFYADSLTGPWREHPRSPIINGDAHISRPCGRVVITGGRIFRYAQDCDPHYGLRVRAFEVTELSTSRYEETPVGRTR